MAPPYSKLHIEITDPTVEVKLRRAVALGLARDVNHLASDFPNGVDVTVMVTDRDDKEFRYIHVPVKDLAAAYCFKGQPPKTNEGDYYNGGSGNPNKEELRGNRKYFPASASIT